MRNELFNDLITSIRQAGAILRGEMKPGRKWIVLREMIEDQDYQQEEFVDSEEVFKQLDI